MRPIITEDQAGEFADIGQSMTKQPWYLAMGACSDEVRMQSGIEVASVLPDCLFSLLRKVKNIPEINVMDVELLITNREQKLVAATLEGLFHFYGSDKSTTHNYHIVYGAILPYLGSTPRILEIGLGTNNLNLISNMGSSGRPGASLRAFMQVVPQGCVHGADIDATIFVEGAKVFVIDQRDLTSYEVIKSEGELVYDLIIDDGMHTADTNINTLIFALGAMSPRGICVIEDISESNLPIWAIVQEILKDSPYSSIVVKSKSAYLFMCFHKGSYKF